MTLLESYPIHRCIFRNDLDTLKELLLDENIKKRINEKDNHGNTPIHLALMLDRRNCIIALINNGCDVITRNNFKWNPTDEALMLGDVDIVEKITTSKYKSYIKKFIETMDEWNQVLPNCYLKVKVKLKSSIPLFEMFGAKDTIEIIKKGKSLRINTTNAGIDSRGMFKLYKGSLSFLFKYDSSLGFYNLFLLDNKNKKYQQFFPYPPQWIINSASSTRIGISTLYKYFIDPRVFSIKIKKQRFLKRKKETIALETGKTFKTDRFKLKNLTLVIRKRGNEMIIGDYKSEIHTKIMKIDYVMDKKKYNDEVISNKLHGLNINEKKFVEEEEEDIDTADEEESDESDLENENENDECNRNETVEQIKKRKNIKKVEHSVFENLVNEKTVVNGKLPLEYANKVFKILNDGHDDKGNKVTKYDLIYVDQFIPNYFSNVLRNKLTTSKASERFNYLSYLASNNKKGINRHVSKDGNTEYFEMKDSLNESLDWETSKENIIQRNNKMKLQNVEGLKEKLNKREKLTEEEYFDPSKTENMHIGRIMEITEERKVFDNFVSLWLSKKDEFPISLNQFRPILHFITSIMFDRINMNNSENDFDGNLYSKVIKESAKILQSDKRFPIKLSFPFYPTIRFVFKTLNCYTEEEKIPDSLFEIPKNYMYSDDAFFKIVK
eukprot:jgi/Orpsp1_1/1190562/evm.model.d7180000079799.1